MKGNYFANIFIHFEPTGRRLGDKTNSYTDSLDPFYPPYIVTGSPEQRNWKSQNPHGWKNKPSPSSPIQQAYSPAGHNAAAQGDVDRLKILAKTDHKWLLHRDENGWEPLHETVRGGHLEAVEFLVKEGGANINSRTGKDRNGNSPLNMALEYLAPGDAVTKFLLSNGAMNHAYAGEL